MSNTKDKIKVLNIIGTRPEAIKMAPIIIEMNNRANVFESITCVTAQHRELLDQVLDLFQISPDYDLDIMEHNQTLEEVTSRLINKLSRLIEKISPNLIVAQGDTTTVFVSALCSFYKQIPFAHVEAGLRSGNKYQPFPEEINRKLCDNLSDIYFAPTNGAQKNLIDEGITEKSIFVTGNTVVDALLYLKDQPFTPKIEEIRKINGGDEKKILLTTHRRENFGQPLDNICSAIKKITTVYPDAKVICPLHPNPNVKSVINEKLGDNENIILIPAVDYQHMIWLMDNVDLILTDSGGIQEEAPTFGKPVLVLRNKTERPEGIEAGVCKLVGTDTQVIVNETKKVFDAEKKDVSLINIRNPYGDGTASKKICSVIENYFNN